MDKTFEEIRSFFLQRHISLRNDWLSDAIDYVKSVIKSDRVTPALIFELWRFSDIKESTHPFLSQNVAEQKCFIGAMVLQLQSVTDIGISYLSQFKKMAYLISDNSDFQTTDAGETATGESSSRLLQLILSDGRTQLKAVEYKLCKQLSLLICPGSKILLYGTIQIRRNVFLLTPQNCQFLGGDVESLLGTNRPIKIMADALGKPLLSSSSSTTSLRADFPVQQQKTTTASGQQQQPPAELQPPLQQHRPLASSSSSNSLNKPFSISSSSTLRTDLKEQLQPMVPQQQPPPPQKRPLSSAFLAASSYKPLPASRSSSHRVDFPVQQQKEQQPMEQELQQPPQQRPQASASSSASLNRPLPSSSSSHRRDDLPMQQKEQQPPTEELQPPPQKRSLSSATSSAPLGEMVVNMHMDLVAHNLPFRAFEFKRRILDVVNEYEMILLQGKTNNNGNNNTTT